MYPRHLPEQCGLSQYDEGYDDLGAAPQQEDEDDDDRIVGGKTTRRSRYPWIVALTLNRGFQFCAGTIINSKVTNASQWVLKLAGYNAYKKQLIYREAG